MKAIYNGAADVSNWTVGKEYNTQPSFVKGFASIVDDNGAEQLIRNGSTLFLWQ